MLYKRMTIINVNAAEKLKKVIADLHEQSKEMFSMPLTLTSGGASIVGYMEHAALAGCVEAVLVELRTNDVFLGHFRAFARGLRQEHPLDAHQVKSLLGTGTTSDQVVAYEKIDGIASFFLEFKGRLASTYASALPNDILYELLEDETHRRVVPSHLRLKLEDGSCGLEAEKQRIVVLRTAQVHPEGGSSPPTDMIKLK